MKVSDIIRDEELAESLKRALKSPETPSETVEILKGIKLNQELERRRWERRNAIKDDIPIYDWAEETVPTDYRVKFTLAVPEGWVFYWSYPSWTWNRYSQFQVWIDGVYQPEITDIIQDFADHTEVFNPPKKVYASAEIWCTNVSTFEKTYACFFGGFLRRSLRAAKDEEPIEGEE